MKKNVYSMALGLVGLALVSAPANAQVPAHRSCATEAVLQAQLVTDPGLAQRMSAINNQALKFAAQ